MGGEEWYEDALVDVPMAAVAGDARGHCMEHRRGGATLVNWG